MNAPNAPLPDNAVKQPEGSAPTADQKPAPPEEAKTQADVARAPEAQPKAPGGVEFGNVNNSDIAITQTQEGDEYQQYFIETNQSHGFIFSWNEGLEISRIDEIESAGRFIYEGPFVNGAIATLSRHRLLILTGSPDSGKESMARYLACRLREEGTIGHDTLLYAPQGQDVRLNLRSLLAREEGLQGRVLIFRDVLERRNPGLSEFLVLLKGESVTNVSRVLERIGSYLILTAVPSTLPPECMALPAMIRSAMPLLSPELLLQGIEQHAARFLSLHPDPALKIADVSAAQLQRITKSCGTISRAVRLIEKDLTAILRSEKSLEEALNELDSPFSWFQQLGFSNIEAWLYCLALVLADPLNRKDGVPWSEFFTFYDGLRRRRDMLRRRKLQTDQPLDEEGLHAQLGVEIKRDSSYVKDIIRFKEPNTGERLWNALLSKSPSMLMDLVPTLCELTGHDSPFVRARAAQALGRIGSLDAYAMMSPLLESWAESASWSERSLVGYAAQGVLAANDREYQRFLLALLDDYAEDKKQTWASISAYKQIATMDFSLGMGKLKKIAASRLAPAFEASHEIEQRLKKLDRELATSKMPGADLVRLVIFSLGNFYENLFQEDRDLARTFKHTLVSLSMNPGLVPVLTQLTHWTLGAPGMGALVCLVFLQRKGIADVLTRQRFTLTSNSGNTGDKKYISCNMVLAALIDDSEAVKVIATFLETMYAALLNFFPPDTAVLLTHLLLDYCRKWVVAALPIPSCQEAMIELVGRLLRSPLKELYERTYDWLASDPDFARPEMAAFAKSAKSFTAK